MKFISLFAIFLTFCFIFPSVSAVGIFGSEKVYSIYWDEELFERVKPGIVGEQPEIIYWRFMQVQGEYDIQYLVMMFFWEYQHHYIVPHEFDWEWYIIALDSDGYALRCAFPEWHYIIGREYNPRLYDNRTFINIGVDNHPVTMFKDNIFGATIKNAYNYSDSDVKRIDGSVLKKAAEDVGFDERLADEPNLFFDKGWFTYKRYSAFRSWKRSFLVFIDRNLKWVDFSD